MSDNPEKSLSRDRALLIIRSILFHRVGRSYEETMHERIGVLLVGQGEQTSIGEECSWREIAQDFLNQEYEPCRLENTFHEFCNLLKEGIARYQGLENKEDIKKFCKELTITKKNLVYFLLKYENIPRQRTPLRGRLKSDQGLNAESSQAAELQVHGSIEETFIRQIEVFQAVLDQYCSRLENEDDVRRYRYREMSEAVKSFITEFENLIRQHSFDSERCP
jgi:hypothetical protein